MEVACQSARGSAILLPVLRSANLNVMHQNVSPAAAWIPQVVHSIVKSHHAHWFVQKHLVLVRILAQSVRLSVVSQFALWIALVISHAVRSVKSHSAHMIARSLTAAQSPNAIWSVRSQQPAKISRYQRSFHQRDPVRQLLSRSTLVVRSLKLVKHPSSMRFQQELAPLDAPLQPCCNWVQNP